MSRNLQSMDDESSSDDALEIVEDEDEELDEIEELVAEEDKPQTPEPQKKPLISLRPVTSLLADPTPSSEPLRTSTTKHPFKYKCPYCFKIYTSRSGLTSHKNSVHLGAKPYRCETCNEHFSSSAQRVAHIHKLHGTIRSERRGVSRTPPIPASTSSSQPMNSQDVQRENVDQIILVVPMSNEEMAEQQLNDSSSSNQIIIIEPEDIEQHQKRKDVKPVKGNTPMSEQLQQADNPLKKMSGTVPAHHIHLLPPALPQSSESFECSDCSLHFEFSDDLIQHLANHPLLVDDDMVFNTVAATNKEPVSCAMCTFVPEAPPSADHAERLRRLSHHIMAEHFKASFPGLETSTKGFYQGIEVNATGVSKPTEEFGIRCPFCRNSYERESHLQIHLRYHHRKHVAAMQPSSVVAAAATTNLAPSWICARCAQVCTDEVKLREHMTKLCPRLGHTCISCGHKYETNAQLADHIKRDHKLNVDVVPQKSYSFNCSYCDKEFASESLVRSHRHICKLKNPFSCPICSKCYSDSFVLLQHIGVDHVSSNQMLTCNKCSYATKSITGFTNHYQTHLLRSKS